jgi:hypothetical protein
MSHTRWYKGRLPNGISALKGSNTSAIPMKTAALEKSFMIIKIIPAVTNAPYAGLFQFFTVLFFVVDGCMVIIFPYQLQLITKNYRLCRLFFIAQAVYIFLQVFYVFAKA